MAERYKISLLSLPVELLYRICDFLDAGTILVSFRMVCNRFYMIAKTYNGYKLHLRTMPKINLQQMIRPENVISLDFWDRTNETNWIDLFLPMFKMNHHFHRLRTFSLHMTDTHNLNVILDHIATSCMLKSFAIYSDIPNGNDDAFFLLSQIIAQPTIETIIIYSNLKDKHTLIWPTHCKATKLSMNTCTIQQFCNILENSPRLDTLIMDSCHVRILDESILSNSYEQVTSLTLNDMRMTMDKLEFLLSLLPSLSHLDLASSGRPFEFVRRLSQWEIFIRLRLCRLNRFEFCIFCYCSNWENFDSLITSFRTPFWLEEKRWFVSCQFRDDWTSSFTLFTTPEPIVLSHRYENYYEKITCA